jgi:phosphoribosylaminoimidazolecarboxamide formyltransferase/IMP cyclohydrolase
VKRIERALISVYDKTGVVEFARRLSALKVEIISTGGTHRLLASNGIRVRDVSDFTGFPEVLDGRVKTIHPRVAAGLLAIRDNAEHARQAAEQNLPGIDLLCVNLYPFAETIRKPGVHFDEVIENIDIGGPTMIRAAAKNFQDVAVVTSPEDYADVLSGLEHGNGALDRNKLFRLAQKAFLLTARYDSMIAQYLSTVGGERSTPHSGFPPNIFMDFEKISDLRYGENPHQQAAFYRWGGQPPFGLGAAQQLQGKELSYNNIVDVEAAWNLAREFDSAACAIIKHASPCGAAIGGTLREAYVKAYETDPVSAFGCVIGFNREFDAETATETAKLFVEAIVAPGFEPEAVRLLAGKKNLRLLAIDPGKTGTGWSGYELKRVSGGVLIQSVDDVLMGPEIRVATRRAPSDEERRDLDFAWRVVKHVRSNAIVLARDGKTLGLGAGQTSRVDSVRISAQRAQATSKGSVLASEALFPFRDGIDEAAKAGVTAVIQPGGSVKDDEVIRAADEHGIAMILTGLRHFRH